MKIKTVQFEYNITDNNSLFDTNINIKTNDIIMITADGTFYADMWVESGVYGPSGRLISHRELCQYIPPICSYNKTQILQHPNDYGYPLKTEPIYCLLGKLNNKYFAIGDLISFCHRGKDARLYLDLNIKNNKIGVGSFQINIKIWRKRYLNII